MQIIRWLDSISGDASEIYLLGDLFDFWYEYRTVVPKGFVRFQAKLAELTDSGIAVHVFTGNHDMWMFRYFEDELGVTMHRGPIICEWSGKRFLIGHGDGLGPEDHTYKFIKKVFSNPLCIWLFNWLHPDIGIGIANRWSGRSRKLNGPQDEVFKGAEHEWLYQYCKRKAEHENFDYFIFGHRHLVLDMKVNSDSRYINLGHWFKDAHFAVFDGSDVLLQPVADSLS